MHRPISFPPVRSFVWLASLSMLLALPACMDAPVAAPAAVPTSRPEVAQRPRVVLLNPIILADDDGSVEAHRCFPKKLVDRCYTQAGLEFLYLEPQVWRHGQARRGEMNLNQICEAAKAAGVLRGQGDIVNLIFVSAIDGRAMTCGRGMLNGNICFICLPKAQNDPEMLEFVVAHEVGHCFGLIHAVDDPLVPDDVPNVQGDGPFAERLAVTGINAHQRDVVLASPLVQDRVRFHTAESGARLMLDESWAPYLSALEPACLRAMLGSADVPDDAAAARAIARRSFPKMVLDFTSEERRMLADGMERLRTGAATRDWELMHRVPWHFIKVKDGFCGGFPHTRGPAILLSERALKAMAADPLRCDALLAHEKMHVLQRFFPERFRQRFAEPCGFQSVAGLTLPEALRAAYMPNPDAQTTWFAVPDAGRQWVPLTMLANVKAPVMGRDFRGIAYPVVPGVNGKPTLDPALGRPFPDDFPEFRRHLPARIDGDHPNEEAAYFTAKFLAPDRPAMDPVMAPALRSFLEESELWRGE